MRRRNPRAPSTDDDMKAQASSITYVFVMAAVIVGVDVLFFKDRFWERLAVNVGLVLVFGAFYFRFWRGG